MNNWSWNNTILLMFHWCPKYYRWIMLSVWNRIKWFDMLRNRSICLIPTDKFTIKITTINFGEIKRTKILKKWELIKKTNQQFVEI